MPRGFIYRPHIKESNSISTPDLIIENVYLADSRYDHLQVKKIAIGQLTTDPYVQVLGTQSGLDAAVLLIASDEGMLLGLASNHRDREHQSVELYSKPISRQIWRFDVVSDNWGKIIVTASYNNGEQLQCGCLDEFVSIDKTISAITEGKDKLKKGTAVLCVGLPLGKVNLSTPVQNYHIQMFCKTNQWELNFKYEVEVLQEK